MRRTVLPGLAVAALLTAGLSLLDVYPRFLVAQLRREPPIQRPQPAVGRRESIPPVPMSPAVECLVQNSPRSRWIDPG